jgi:hypothetical protein
VPIACALLTSGNSTADSNSYATASISPPGSELNLLFVVNGRASGGNADPPNSVTGACTTWTLVDSQCRQSGSLRCTAIFRCLEASPGTSAVTIGYPNTQTSAEWAFVHCEGTTTSGTNGSGAIVQVVKDAPAGITNTPTLTLAAFADTDNAVIAVFAIGQNDTMTHEAGFTELHESPSYIDSWFKDEVEWKAAPGDTTPSITLPASRLWEGIAVELGAP